MVGAQRLDGGHVVEDLLREIAGQVISTRHRPRRQQPALQGCGPHQTDVVPLRRRQDALQRALVEQTPALGDDGGVELPRLDVLSVRRRVVGRGAHPLHDAFLLQLTQSPECPVGAHHLITHQIARYLKLFQQVSCKRRSSPTTPARNRES